MGVHAMELPRRVVVGPDEIKGLGDFITALGLGSRVLVVTGEHVRDKVGEAVHRALVGTSHTPSWVVVEAARMEEVKRVEEIAIKESVDVLIGLGGGKCVDVAKLASYNRGIPFISVPTSASHDGVSSPFASIKGLDTPYSIISHAPLGILADLTLIAKAPHRLLASGCGDLIAKITAVRDWELARDERGEYFGQYAASLARLSADIVMRDAKRIGQGETESVRNVVEALISAGVAAGIAGTSRPCSGAEHLFSHALDIIAPGAGLHGEKCGVGTIMISKLYGFDWEAVAEALREMRAPASAEELGVKPEGVAKALVLGPSIRPDRYTILHKLMLNEQAALKLARDTLVA